jgi:hypothetical protein
MIGTYPYCRTNEAIKWLEDGDTIQHLETEIYFKKENDIVYTSTDNIRWEEFTQPMEIFPTYTEWRSISDLHYFTDLIDHIPLPKYLTSDDRVIGYDHPEADITKKRWFALTIL